MYKDVLSLWHKNNDTMSTKRKLRLFSHDDLASVVRLFTQTVHIVSGSYYSPDEVEAWAPSQPDMALWENYFDDRYTLVMDSADGITGFGCLNVEGDTADLLFTHHAHQSEGIGSSILEVLEKEAVRRGKTEIMLTASATALTFYQKRGYRYHHSEKKKYGTMMFDCQILCKTLNITSK